jgi:hypothetical protein
MKSFSAMQMPGDKPPLWLPLQGDGNETDVLR